MTTGIPTEVANRLVLLASSVRSADRPIDQRLAKARLEAASQIASGFGLGGTPFVVEPAALEAVDTCGVLPPATAHNTDRKNWLPAARASS